MDNTFDPAAFERIKNAENRHFWFNVRRSWIFDKIKKYIPPPARFLDVGCGTGLVSSFLAQKGYDVTGCEFYHDAIDAVWPGFRIVQGDAVSLPFEDNSFDVVGLFDVIEHFEDDALPLKEAARVAKSGGFVTVTVPSRKELWSGRDIKAFHKRRYEKKDLSSVISAVGLEPLLTEYLFMSLYLPMRYIGMKGAVGDQFKINPLANMLFAAALHAERLISRAISLPIGTSLIIVSQKRKA